jgi:hypothetical protein
MNVYMNLHVQSHAQDVLRDVGLLQFSKGQRPHRSSSVTTGFSSLNTKPNVSLPHAEVRRKLIPERLVIATLITKHV